MLRAPGDHGRDVRLLQLETEDRPGLLDLLLPVGAPVGDHRLDLRVLPRVEDLEREILELPLQGVDPEAVRERRVDLERLLRLLHLLLLPEVLDRPHVVEAVGELDEDDPDVLGHRDDHLAVVLGLRLLAARELDPRQLRDTLDELRDLGAELGAELVELGVGVLEDIVQERGRDRLLVEMELGADAGYAPWVVDELLAGAPHLTAMAGLGGLERTADEVVVDARVVRLDAGQQLLDEVLVMRLSADDRHEAQCTARTSRFPPSGRGEHMEDEPI